MDRRWPYSAGIPGAVPPLLSMENPGPSRANQSTAELPTIQPADADPRVLFAAKFWGRRRFSDSVSQLPHRLNHTAQAPCLRQLNQQIGNTNGTNVPDTLSHHSIFHPNISLRPASTRNFPAPPPQLHIHHHHHHHHHHHFTTSSPARPLGVQAPAVTSNQEPDIPNPVQTPGFLHIQGYAAHTIHPSHPPPVSPRREDVRDALAQIEVKSGPVTLKGVGSLAAPLVSDRGPSGVLNSFLERHARRSLVPLSMSLSLSESSFSRETRDRDGLNSLGERARVGSDYGVLNGSVRGRGRGRGDMKRTWGGAEAVLTLRELGMLESDLFDVGKFLTAGEGAVGGRYLTVLTWSEDNVYGTVALFKVEVESPPGGKGLTARRRLVPPPLHTCSRRGRVVGVRPVVAMEDVPRPILVGMRLDQAVKKAVLQYDNRRGRFRWTAQHTRRGPPIYARVDGLEDARQIHTASGTGFKAEGRSRGGKSLRRNASSMERRLLGARDVRQALLHHGSKIDHSPQYADGVVATAPQLLVLLHASRSIIEQVSSTPVTTRTMETEDGERVRGVWLDGIPKGTRYRGKGVHVAVLVPDGARWAEERIFWTEGREGLAELRQKIVLGRD
ncbi:hypothetical protein N658DRAFT_490156 [Parathielavia hyrcaniae]|uniref:Uncharacterized protein n=1 Tax=Parathielavia hyrcaniae TaxID=113614 RepID=A0AAN6PR20_9PEZI|nr:hypothetical protein N658DRAFT_490156 [Parathielavia hyrcaniae]